MHNYNMIQPKHQLSHNVPAINQDYRNILSEKKLLAQPPQHLKTQDPKSHNVSVIVNARTPSKDYLTPIVFKSKKYMEILTNNQGKDLFTNN